MKPHTEEQVEGLHSYAEANCEGDYLNFEFHGINVEYKVMDIPENQKPFDYAIAAAVVGTGEDARYEIIVSSDVPEDLRGLWAWHEYNDFAILGHETEHRCLQSEQTVVEELLISDQELLDHYLEYRIKFYNSLAIFMANDIDIKGKESDYHDYDVVGAKDAMDYLESFRNRPRLELISGKDIDGVADYFIKNGHYDFFLYAGRVSSDHCDEAVIISQQEHICGMATISQQGDGDLNRANIDVIYTNPDDRNKGYGKVIIKAAIERCVERGFGKIHIDVLNPYVIKMIESLPQELKDKLEVVDLTDMPNLADLYSASLLPEKDKL